MGVCNCSMYCCTLLYVHSSIAIILMGKRELIALLNLSSWCLVMVEPLFLAVPRGCLQFVIVVFPDHTHLLFFILNKRTRQWLLQRKLPGEIRRKELLSFSTDISHYIERVRTKMKIQILKMDSQLISGFLTFIPNDPHCLVLAAGLVTLVSKWFPITSVRQSVWNKQET